MNKENKITIKTIKGTNYQRFFITDTRLSNIADYYSVDLFEDYIDSISMFEKEDSDENVYAIRELKGTILLPKDEAKELAEKILKWVKEEEKQGEQKEEVEIV
ncbi:hypothetical protein [Bacillus rhizoplanae]|uniref:hypothetical protein n=1 Tax=Bacillus rhizoplanae TaxID=2880966 RepID=UPI003D1AA08D